LVDRPRLVTRFGASHNVPKLTLVIAPAGYGKSTLLAQYISSANKVLIAWLSLDEGDNNIDTFTNYLLASYQKVSPAQHDGSFKRFLPAPSASSKTRLNLLFNNIVEAGRPIQFVLDDFHLIKNERILELVDWLLKMMPAEMSLIVASREHPKLSCLVELKAQGNLIEIPAEELNFTLKETQSFLSSDQTIKLGPESTNTLHQRTEGWIAATQLALHALHQTNDPQTFIERFTGTDRDIVKYLGEMVLDQQSDDTRRFFLQTAVLKRFNAELCNDVTGIKDAAQFLEQISHAGLFLFELDRERTWFRYHHLFRDFLVAHLRATEPEKYAELSLKAAQWFEQRGYIDEAVDYYLSAKQFEVAARLIAEHVSQIVQYHGKHEVLLHWVDSLPERYIKQEPQIAICLAWSLIFTRSLNRVDDILQMIKEQGQLPPNPENQASRKQYQQWIQWNLEMLTAMYDVMSGHYLEAKSETELWLKTWPSAPQFERGVVLGVLGAVCLQTLEFKTARSVLSEAKKAFSSSQAEYGVAWMNFVYALILTKQGHLNESKHLLSSSLVLANEKMGEHSLASALLSLGLGQVFYECNDLANSKQCIDRGFYSIEDHGHIDTAHIAFLTQSKLLARGGNQAGSLALLLDAEAFGRQLNLSHFDTAIIAERIRRFLITDNVDAAVQLHNEHKYDEESFSAVNYTPFESVIIQSLQARIALAESEPQKAVDILSKLSEHCQRKGYQQLYFCLSILLARAYFDLNNVNKSLRILNKTIAIAAPEKQLSSFIDEQYYLAPLWSEFFSRFDKLVPEKRETEEGLFTTALRDALALKTTSPVLVNDSKQEGQVMSEKLSKRELELLENLDQGLSNQELASALFVSVSTIKWHLTHIYSKLGVKNRIEAVKIFQKIR